MLRKADHIKRLVVEGSKKKATMEGRTILTPLSYQTDVRPDHCLHDASIHVAINLRNFIFISNIMTKHSQSLNNAVVSYEPHVTVQGAVVSGFPRCPDHPCRLQ
jgi:hypothetical protein